jgi:type IV pilus assembly protein PilQ
VEVQSHQEVDTPMLPEAAKDIAYTGARIDADFQEIPVRTLFMLIAETSGRRIEVDESVTGAITLRVENVPWDQVLDMVLKMKGLEKRVEDDVILITPL